MRLSQLDPDLDTEDMEPGVAWLHFDCPHCGGKGYIGCKIAITPEPGSTRVWKWNGETDPEKITLEPSLNMAGHWHGFVTNGEVTTV